jgi:hypothetical protein
MGDVLHRTDDAAGRRHDPTWNDEMMLTDLLP